MLMIKIYTLSLDVSIEIVLEYMQILLGGIVHVGT